MIDGAKIVVQRRFPHSVLRERLGAEEPGALEAGCAHRGEEDEALDAGALGGAQQTQGPESVHLLDAARRLIADRRGEVDHGVGAAERVAKRVRVAEIAERELDPNPCGPSRRGSRTSARTGSPASTRVDTNALPTVPVAPVIAITRLVPILWTHQPRRLVCLQFGIRSTCIPGQGGSVAPANQPRGSHETVTYVISEPCIGEKDNSCVEVCPVDCIHPTPDEPDYDNVEQLYIDPDECIDCDACVEACPVDACFAEDQLPEEWAKYTQINADYYKAA